MVCVSLFRMREVPEKLDIFYGLDGERVGDCSFEAKQSVYGDEEIQVEVSYEEELEAGMKRFFSEDAKQIADFLKEKGKEKILRKVFCFVNRETRTVEIYRGSDYITAKIREALQKLLKVDLERVSLNSQQLLSIVNQNSEEVKQAMFKYLHGLWYHIMRGNKLENNQKYLEYLSAKPESLRMVSVIPKINWVNGSKYMVSFNGETGTIGMGDGAYRWKPRQEIKQFVDLILRAAD
ncbi:MAG: hypothetical protein GW780_00405 [Candidatus Aenigmarchaeota archaeon]|nr:hypothetical protein [Candidatus Aenigmarchaeota archaeon]NCS70616.1 hypothetical protein [Candidatus Aenigmarchaeota archaeon]